MSVVGRKINDRTYHRLLIPEAEVMNRPGLPQVPVVTKLIAIPDCDNVTLSASHSNELRFEGYDLLPGSRPGKKIAPDGSDVPEEVFEEDKAAYASGLDFPGKYAEVVETGYVRGQKVARIAIYPVQFNPAHKTLSVFTDFDIALTFVNPSSPANKELGIFRNMMLYEKLSGNPRDV